MFGLEKFADWWDSQHEISKKELDKFVEAHSGWFSIIVATSAATAMELGGGMVDVLRIGEGVKQGGWGYAQDSLRLLSLAGPVTRLGRLGFAKFTPNINGGVCAFIASAKALRHTGTKLFITASDLMKASGGQFVVNDMHQFAPVLRKLGARLKVVKPANLTSLEQITMAHKKSVVLFGVNWEMPMKNGATKTVGHALYAFRDSLGQLKIADRTGKIVKKLEDLNRFYPDIGNARIQGSAIVVMNAMMVEGSTLASLLALEVRMIISSDAKGEVNIVVNTSD